MTTLPSGWASVPLGELVEATRPRVNPRDADGLQFIGMDHVEPQTMRLLGTVPAPTMKSAAVQLEPGDVLYGRLRPYLNKVYRPQFPRTWFGGVSRSHAFRAPGWRVPALSAQLVRLRSIRNRAEYR